MRFTEIFEDPFFREQSMVYDLIRSGEKIDKVRFIKGSSSITIFPESFNKVKVNDILSRESDEFIITSTLVKSNETEQYKTQTVHDYESSKGVVIHADHDSQVAYNSTNVNQANSKTVTMQDIKNQAFDIKPNDQELYRELVSKLESFEKGETEVKKGSLQKFGILLKDYGALGVQVTQLIYQILVGQ